MAPINKYPRQIAVVKRNKITLAIDANLELAGRAKNSRGEEYIVSPLIMHGPRSCFRWTLIDTSGVTPVYPVANIPCEDVATFSKRVDAVIQNNILTGNRAEKKDDTEISPAYTVKLRMREFKGRTPANILLEDESNKDKLLDLAEYLKKQGEHSRYWESNLQQIRAIEDAIKCMESGTLSKKTADRDVIVIYDIPQKILEHRPPKGETKEHFFVYAFKIEYLTGYTYPWHIRIQNAYMKMKRMPNETIQTIPGTAILKSSCEIELTDYEMGYITDQIVKRKNNFEQAYFPKQYKESIEQSQALRDYLKMNPDQDNAA